MVRRIDLRPWTFNPEASRPALKDLLASQVRTSLGCTFLPKRNKAVSEKVAPEAPRLSITQRLYEHLVAIAPAEILPTNNELCDALGAECVADGLTALDKAGLIVKLSAGQRRAIRIVSTGQVLRGKRAHPKIGTATAAAPEAGAADVSSRNSPGARKGVGAFG